MSVLGLFIIGAFVTALVGTALGLVIWGAIMDGRRKSALQLSRAQSSNGR